MILTNCAACAAPLAHDHKKRCSRCTLDDLREAVSMLEDTNRIGRRVFGGTHPLAATIERELQVARAALDTRETPSANA